MRERLAKRRDWRRQLDEFLAHRQDMPFLWGVRDCALFAADAVAAMTGVDVAAAWRERYSTARGAARILRGRRLADFAVEVLGTPLLNPLTARYGDIGIVLLSPGQTLGVVTGPHVACQGSSGIVLVPIRNVSMAWRLEGQR